MGRVEGAGGGAGRGRRWPEDDDAGRRIGERRTEKAAAADRRGGRRREGTRRQQQRRAPHLSSLVATAAAGTSEGRRRKGAPVPAPTGASPVLPSAVLTQGEPAHSTRLLQTRVIVDRFNVLQADAQDLVRDAAISDRVDLRITGDVGAKILVLGFSSPKVQVSVDCAIAISPRRQSLTYKQCGVDGLSV
uniref:Late embryogenesis abundant protein LEA-2 subgroup domain-containing protein n=1 Tax=Oryza barthii TaxID=65489 RepID=A0A0D3FGI2_9ORYZ